MSALPCREGRCIAPTPRRRRMMHLKKQLPNATVRLPLVPLTEESDAKLVALLSPAAVPA